MPKAHLTQAFVANAGCEVGKKKSDHYDLSIKGFVLEVRCTGGKTYYLRYVDQAGTQKQYKIGGYNDITFAAAKKRAQQLRLEVVMGGDPGAKKALAKSIPLYGELAEKHLAFAKLHLKSYHDLESCMRIHIVPKWGKTRLTDITSQSVGQWLNEKRVGGLAPASVEKMRVILGRSFVLGASWDIPGTERNPTRGIPRKPLNNGRERFLTPEETARLATRDQRGEPSGATPPRPAPQRGQQHGQLWRRSFRGRQGAWPRQLSIDPALQPFGQ